jgi:6-phospho-beta-glucosidase
MKVAVLGGGGFRTPVAHGCLARIAGTAGIDEVVLQDPDAERLVTIGAVIEGMDRERGGVAVAVRTTTSLEDAVEGAGAVWAAIRVGGAEGRVVDEQVPLTMGVLGQETVGPAGIAFALRTIPVVRAIADVVRDRAPSAWFVNFTNPAGVVTQAARDVLGDRAVGICDSPAALCARVAAAIGVPPEELSFDYAGLNHLGWLLGVETAGGDDALPGLLADDRRLARVDEARLFGPERLRDLGAIPNEYLVYVERPGEVADAFHRDGARGEVVAAQQRSFFTGAPRDPAGALAAWRRARDARHGTYLAEGWAVASWDPPRDDRDVGATGPGEEGYAAIAADLLLAARSREPRPLVLDAPSGGRLPGVEDHEVAELTCDVSRSGIAARPGRRLPSGAAELVATVKEVERLTLRAAVEGSRRLALEALATHPVVPSRELAQRILDGYLERHDGLRERLR